ncbi:divalent-cation tolerance protein CutA [soil metagenome]
MRKAETAARPDATAAVVVLATAPSQEVAERIVTIIVEERLAACGSIVPGVTSIYRWQDAVQKDAEVLIVFKTERASARGLITRMTELHPYDVPEALVLPVVEGLPSYLAWIAENIDG